MSFSTWSEDGYGFPLFNDKNFKNIKQFIIDNNDGFYDIEELNKAKDQDDLETVINDNISIVIADMINEIEDMGIFCGYSAGEESEEMIGITPIYSWSAKPNDIITRDKADELLSKYAQKLGITEKADFFEVKYCG